jgi:hypothetical protein
MRDMKPWRVVTYDKQARPLRTSYFDHYEVARLCARLVNASALSYGLPLATWVESNAE